MRLFRRRDAGFTIIEVLVALTLLAAVILLVTRAFLTVLSVTSQGGRVTVATALAAKQLEAVRTRVEAQPDRTNWRNEFCAIAAQATTVFAAPYGAYSYRVLLNDQAVAAAPGQEDLLLPCWSVEWARGGGGGGEAGVWLVEIVVGLAILVIALGGIYGLVSQSVRSFGVSEDFLDVQQNARVALGKLAEEAKWAQAVSADSPTCPWPSCVELSVSADNPIKNPPAAYTVRFQWNSGAQQLERVEGATVTPLADSITGVVFRYLDRNGADTTVAADVVSVEAGGEGGGGGAPAPARRQHHPPPP